MHLCVVKWLKLKTDSLFLIKVQVNKATACQDFSKSITLCCRPWSSFLMQFSWSCSFQESRKKNIFHNFLSFLFFVNPKLSTVPFFFASFTFSSHPIDLGLFTQKHPVNLFMQYITTANRDDHTGENNQYLLARNRNIH